MRKCTPRLNFEQFVGKEYGSLTFLRVAESKVFGKRRRMIEVRCKCGVVKDVDWDNLRRGKQQSCGCQRTPKRIGRDHRLSCVWVDMKQRCLNPNNIAYKYYGGKGVKIVDEWMKYENFFNWAISNGYKDGLELDKDTHGGMLYGPDTCVFLTRAENVQMSSAATLTKEQADVIRVSKVETRFLAKEYGVHKETIRALRRGDTWKI